MERVCTVANHFSAEEIDERILSAREGWRAQRLVAVLSSAPCARIGTLAQPLFPPPLSYIRFPPRQGSPALDRAP
jgi:hypothetical protein